jgi:cupin 2 domain-containing protein
VNEPVPGRYRHYKGNEYTVVGVARHSETLAEVVVYRQEYGEHGLWVRPRRMFMESVQVNGQDVPRFEHLQSEAAGAQVYVKSLFADLPRHLAGELVTTLVGAANMRIERIVSHGHASPAGFWYDQDEHEWVFILQGAARLRFEDETVAMKPGDFVIIPAHKKHRVDWTPPDEPTIWLAVHYGVGSNEPRTK